MKVFKKFEETKKYKLEQSNTELLKQNEALVECLKELLQLHKDGLYSTKRIAQANELLNTLNK